MADLADVTHLLRRTEFVARPERVEEYLAPGISRADVVDDVLDAPIAPPLPPYFQQYDPTNGGWQHYEAACAWWIERMLDRPRPVLEKLVLFWHGHLTSSWSEIHLGYHMMKQTQTYRVNALGNLRTMLQAMALEPAMLVYLSNAFNHKATPNQNFGRELLELFTIGVGNYTEEDVADCARAWTGHNYHYELEQYVFDPAQHDDDPKTIFGVTRNWDGPAVIDHILDTPGLRLLTARLLVRKLWEHLAAGAPSAALVEQLANVLIDADLDGRQARPPRRGQLPQRPRQRARAG